MSPEKYFILYAFPCSHLKVQRGDISQETFDGLQKAAQSSQGYERSELEKIYAPAIAFMKDVANEINAPLWSIETVATYFLLRHNKIIDEKRGNYAYAPESMRNFCKVYEAKVIQKFQDALVVSYSNGKRNVSNTLTPDAEVGDEVTIHHGFAVEIIRPESICWKYLRK